MGCLFRRAVLCRAMSARFGMDRILYGSERERDRQVRGCAIMKYCLRKVFFRRPSVLSARSNDCFSFLRFRYKIYIHAPSPLHFFIFSFQSLKNAQFVLLGINDLCYRTSKTGRLVSGCSAVAALALWRASVLLLLAVMLRLSVLLLWWWTAVSALTTVSTLRCTVVPLGWSSVTTAWRPVVSLWWTA